ncbi:MAG: hypothetical protein ACRD3T_20040 [Terriglobia bacterium]
MDDFNWSKSEKAAARRAFDTAYQRECSAIRAKLKTMIESASDSSGIWRIHDYLSEQRDQTDKKYDYRYSVLILVFARLLNEGWVVEGDLLGIGEDKIERIKQIANL